MYLIAQLIELQLSREKTFWFAFADQTDGQKHRISTVRSPLIRISAKEKWTTTAKKPLFPFRVDTFEKRMPLSQHKNSYAVEMAHESRNQLDSVNFN